MSKLYEDHLLKKKKRKFKKACCGKYLKKKGKYCKSCPILCAMCQNAGRNI